MLKEINAIDTFFNFEWSKSNDDESVTSLNVVRQIVLQRAVYNYGYNVEMEAGYGYGYGYQSYHLELELNIDNLEGLDYNRILFLDKDKVKLYTIDAESASLNRFKKINLINVPMLVLRHPLTIRFEY